MNRDHRKVCFCVIDGREHFGTWADWRRWMEQTTEAREWHLLAVLTCVPNITVSRALDMVLQ